MKNDSKALVAKTKGQTKPKNRKKVVRRCENCGRPATRVAKVSFDVHWFELPMNGFCDDDAQKHIVDLHMCNYCDLCWRIPKKELQRSAALFGVTART